MSNKIVLVYIKDYGALNDEGKWYNNRYLSYVGVFHDITEAYNKRDMIRESMNREHDSLYLTNDLSCNYEDCKNDDSMCEFEENTKTNGVDKL